MEMSQYYLAVDIGASSGHHMLAHMQDGKIKLEEIYRFEDGMKRVCLRTRISSSCEAINLLLSIT